MITRVIEGCVRWVRGVGIERQVLDTPRAWFGAIAQLGERVLCKHEVVGSIPSGSTTLLALATPLAEPAASTYPCLKR